MLLAAGFPSSKFWIVWPICSLIIAVVAFVAAVLQKLIGAAGRLLTVIVMILLGNPSSGGATASDGVGHGGTITRSGVIRSTTRSTRSNGLFD